MKLAEVDELSASDSVAGHQAPSASIHHSTSGDTDEAPESGVFLAPAAVDALLACYRPQLRSYLAGKFRFAGLSLHAATGIVEGIAREPGRRFANGEKLRRFLLAVASRKGKELRRAGWGASEQRVIGAELTANVGQAENQPKARTPRRKEVPPPTAIPQTFFTAKNVAQMDVGHLGSLNAVPDGVPDWSITPEDALLEREEIFEGERRQEALAELLTRLNPEWLAIVEADMDRVGSASGPDRLRLHRARVRLQEQLRNLGVYSARRLLIDQ